MATWTASWHLVGGGTCWILAGAIAGAGGCAHRPDGQSRDSSGDSARESSPDSGHDSSGPDSGTPARTWSVCGTAPADFPEVQAAVEGRSAILTSRNGYEASKAGRAAPRREAWTTIPLALMLDLLRAKYRQHPDLAEQLLRTGEARLYNRVAFSTFWGSHGQRGTNWLGRLLEIVGSELQLERRNARVVQGLP